MVVRKARREPKPPLPADPKHGRPHLREFRLKLPKGHLPRPKQRGHIGKIHQMSMSATWCYYFQLNEWLYKYKYNLQVMEDLKIAKLMLEEFPTSKAVVNAVRPIDCKHCGAKETDWRAADKWIHKIRIEYNHGYHSSRIAPKIKSYRYDCFGQRLPGNRKRYNYTVKIDPIKPEMIEPLPDPTVNLHLYHPLLKKVGTNAVARGKKLLARNSSKDTRKRKEKRMVGS